MTTPLPVTVPALTQAKATGRAVLLAGVFYFFAIAGFFFNLVSHPSDLLVGIHADGHNDLTSWFIRTRETPVALSIRNGGFSAWDPTLGCGMPVIGNPQTALFYPPNWLCFAFEAEAILSWLVLAHLAFAGTGMFALCRRLELSVPSALFSGLIACALPYPVAHLAEGHVAQVCTVAWFPWILLAFEAFLLSNGQRWKSLAITTALSFLCGHVQELYYLMLLLGGVVLFKLALAYRGHASPPDRKKLVVYGVLCGAVCLGLVAVDLVPTLLNSRQTARSGRLPMELAGEGLTLQHLRQLIDPFALGLPGEKTERYGFYWCFLCYFGIAPLLLAFTGSAARWHQPAVRRFFWMSVVAFVFAFGAKTPLYRFAWNWIPQIGSFRMPSRSLFIVSFLIAGLAAFGVEALLYRRADKTGQRTVSRGGLLVAVILAVASCFELGRHAQRITDVAPRGLFRHDSEISQYVKPRLDGQRVLALQSLYSDLETLRDGGRKVRGYEPVAQVRLAWLIDALFDVDDGQLDFGGFQDVNLSKVNDRIADLAGVKYFITGRRQRVREGWPLVLQGTVPRQVTLRGHTSEPLPFFIHENTDVLPRAFLVGEPVNVAGLSTSERVDSLEQINPRQQVLIEQVSPLTEPGCEFTPAEIKADLPDRVVIHTNADRPGLLVLTDLSHPGWSATLDDQPTAVLPANLAFRAVVVPAGKHVVEFRYRSPGFKAGLSLSAVTLLLLGLHSIVALRAGKRQTRGVTTG